MKIAIIGSRSITECDISKYVSENDEIVSGGANGVDQCAAVYAKKHGLKLTEFLPQYQLYGRAAPIMRNKDIVNYSDMIIAFWDGASKGTLWVINYSKKQGKECKVILVAK